MAIMNPYNYQKPTGMSSNMPGMASGGNLAYSAPESASKVKTDVYLEQKIMNARPEELTLMLYDGLIKFIRQAMLFNEQKNYPKSNASNLRAQAIVQELRSSLNMDIDMSHGLEDLYLFMIDHLVNANLEKSNGKLQEVLDLATDLRDTWKQAMRL